MYLIISSCDSTLHKTGVEIKPPRNKRTGLRKVGCDDEWCRVLCQTLVFVLLNLQFTVPLRITSDRVKFYGWPVRKNYLIKWTYYDPVVILSEMEGRSMWGTSRTNVSVQSSVSNMRVRRSHGMTCEHCHLELPPPQIHETRCFPLQPCSHSSSPVPEDYS